MLRTIDPGALGLVIWQLQVVQRSQVGIKHDFTMSLVFGNQNHIVAITVVVDLTSQSVSFPFHGFIGRVQH